MSTQAWRTLYCWLTRNHAWVNRETWRRCTWCGRVEKTGRMAA